MKNEIFSLIVNIYLEICLNYKLKQKSWMIVLHCIEVILKRMTYEDCVFGNNCVQKGMKS
jgi:hypothetical protein